LLGRALPGEPVCLRGGAARRAGDRGARGRRRFRAVSGRVASVLMSDADTHRVVVIGGGFGGLQAVAKLARAPVEITLIDRRNFHLFQPLTYQVATGALSAAEVAYPLRAIFKRRRNVRALMGNVTAF